MKFLLLLWCGNSLAAIVFISETRLQIKKSAALFIILLRRWNLVQNQKQHAFSYDEKRKRIAAMTEYCLIKSMKNIYKNKHRPESLCLNFQLITIGGHGHCTIRETRITMIIPKKAVIIQRLLWCLNSPVI